MDSNLLYDVFIQGLRTLFVIGAPIVLALSIAGIVSSSLQAATSINDPASGYGIRLLALVVVLYLLSGMITEQLLALGQLAFK